MTISFVSLFFIWLLPVTASNAVTSGQNPSFTNVMTSEKGMKFTYNQLMTQEPASLNPRSQVSSQDITQSFILDENLTEEKTPSTTSSLQTSQTPAQSPIHSTSSKSNSPTMGIKSTTEVTTSATAMVTTAARPSTTNTEVRNSTQNPDPAKTQNSQFTSDKMTRPSTDQSFIFTITPSTEPNDNKSKSTSPVTGGDATQSGQYKTSIARTLFIHTTEAKKRQTAPPEKKSNKGTKHSKAVAGIIGGALVLMMVGFLLIFILKQKFQKQHIKNKDWAGPSPFLEGGADNDQVTLRSSRPISLSSLLPQRLSKSLLPETELENIIPGTTFGDKHQDSIFSQKVDGNDGQKGNGTATEDSTESAKPPEQF